MIRRDDRKYFIVKHDLGSFKMLPNFIWRTTKGPRSMPRNYKQVKEGDRWVGFAYTSDVTERPLSLVTGFYECTGEGTYRRVPKELPLSFCSWKRRGYAWMVEGKLCGRQPRLPVGVPPIKDFLRPKGKRVFNNTAIVPIDAGVFDRMRDYTLHHQLRPENIPLLGREPECEQELLAAVISGHKKLGIEKIIRVRTAFPDLLVKLEGKRDQVHMELEVYSQSFISHRHHEQVSHRRFREDGKPVAVLCWIDNQTDQKDRKLMDYVHRVYELQTLIREGRKIRW